MKKTILALMLGLLLTGCASNVENNVNSDTDSTSTAVTQEDSEANDIEEKNNDSTSLPRMNPYTADDNGYCANFEVVKFGSYEQDGNTENGTEAIEWYIIGKEDGKSLLLSKYTLICTSLNDINEDITWEKCTLRKYLNSEFYNVAFDDKEKNMMKDTLLVNKDDDVYGTNGGNDTEDRVFILSVDEITQYFDFTYEKKGTLTFDYASNDFFSTTTANTGYSMAPVFKEESFAYVSENFNIKNSDAVNTEQIEWWVRTPGKTQKEFITCHFGTVTEDNTVYATNIAGVRPAIWVDEAALTMYQ